MKYSMKIVALATLAALVFACGKKNEQRTTANDTPKALQDHKDVVSELKSYSRGDDLVTSLYDELVQQNPTLKKLEDDFTSYQKKQDGLFDAFNNYDGKSKNYYRSAELFSSRISDSTLKKYVAEVIKLSSDKYKAKTAVYDNLIAQINNNSTKITDKRLALKIVATLPLIEKYQDSNKPSTQALTDMVKEQDKLILQTEQQMK